MTDEIPTILAKYIAAEILKQPDRIIKSDEPLLSSGLVDSFHLVDLSLFVEKNFGVRIDDAELNASSFDNLNQLTQTKVIQEELETRKLVERGKGILMKHHGLSEEEAFKRIRKASMDSRKTMREIAEAILLTDKMGG